MQRLGRNEPVRCSRCEQRQIPCEQVSVAQARYFPRPTRTGRRIELGRQLHGTAMYAEVPDADKAKARPPKELTWPRLYLQLLNCFFSYPFTFAPAMEYDRFSQAFNRSFGDVHIMARYLNGQEGDEPTREFFVHTSSLAVMNDSKIPVYATPETMETLLTTICAWGALHILLPFESLDLSILEPIGRTSLLQAARDDPDLGFRCSAPIGTPTSITSEPGTSKRQKRRQGVACDTCRLRRVRCDLMEQPPGVNSCSRCRVKHIVCTDRYIQWRRGRDMIKNAGSLRSLPDVQLLPRREEFMDLNQLPPSIRQLSQQELIDYGMMREPIHNHFMRRALILVHKYDLVNQCTAQGTVVLTLLASMLDYVRPKMSYESQRVANLHLMRLFCRAEFDLGCLMQEMPMSEQIARLSCNRLPHIVWVRDAVTNVSYLRQPQLPKYFCVVGYRGGLDATVCQLSVREYMAVSEEVKPSSAVVMYALLTMVIGHVAHKTYETVMTLPALQVIPPTMDSVAEIRKACEGMWDELHMVELTMHILAAKMRESTRNMLPLNMLLWSWLILTLNFLLYQAIMRRVTDWFSSTKAYHQWAMYSEETQTEPILEATQDLLRDAQLSTLGISRTIAHFTRNLLPTGLLFRGSSLIRQLFRVAQCIARALSVSDECNDPFPEECDTVPGPSTLQSLLNPLDGEAQAAPPPRPITCPTASPHDLDLLLLIPDSRSHEPFTRRNKRQEIEWCIQGLGQIGFSQTGIDTEIRRIIDLVQYMR